MLIGIIWQEFILDCYVNFLNKCMNPKGLFIYLFIDMGIINVEQIENANIINIIKYKI